MEEIVFNGLIFIMQNHTWKVITEGENGWWGVICLETHAFTFEKTEDIIKYLNQ